MKKLLFFATVFIAVFFVVSCSKQGRSGNAIPPPGEILSTQELATRFTQPISSDCQQLISQYRQLDLANLTQFWLAVNKITRHVNVLTTAEQDEIIDRIKKQDERSRDFFGKPFNQLEGDQLIKVVSPEINDKEAKIIFPPDPPACSLYTYPYQFWPSTAAPSPAAAFHTLVAYDVENNCDGVEYAYTGTYWSAMRPITPLGQSVMINASGSTWPWRVRKEGGYTRVFAPVSFVTIWFGTLDAFNDHVRVTTPNFED